MNRILPHSQTCKDVYTPPPLHYNKKYTQLMLDIYKSL